jgi:hypothetical protein
MKTIKFTAKELDFIRNQYQVELEEAEKYIKKLKNIISKLGPLSKDPILDIIEKKPGKRGRKPKAKNEKVLSVPKKRKQRSDKGVKRGQRTKPAPGNIGNNLPVATSGLTKTGIKPAVRSKPKKTGKKNTRRKKQGIRLVNLKKPLPMKEATTT